jgi:hypothetical protein
VKLLNWDFFTSLEIILTPINAGVAVVVAVAVAVTVCWGYFPGTKPYASAIHMLLPLQLPLP